MGGNMEKTISSCGEPVPNKKKDCQTTHIIQTIGDITKLSLFSSYYFYIAWFNKGRRVRGTWTT